MLQRGEGGGEADGGLIARDLPSLVRARPSRPCGTALRTTHFEALVVVIVIAADLCRTLQLPGNLGHQNHTGPGIWRFAVSTAHIMQVNRFAPGSREEPITLFRRGQRMVDVYISVRLQRHFTESGTAFSHVHGTGLPPIQRSTRTTHHG